MMYKNVFQSKMSRYCKNENKIANIKNKNKNGGFRFMSFSLNLIIFKEEYANFD